MVENNKRIKMKAANKKIKKKLKQKQQQKQIVTQNVKVVVGSKPRAKSAAPRKPQIQQPNIISISMPQYQQPATNYYESNMNEARKRQQEDYTQLLKNPFETSIKTHQAAVEKNENSLVKAGILPTLAAEPNDTSKLNAMLAARLNQQQKLTAQPTAQPKTTTTQQPKPTLSFQEELKAKFQSGLKSSTERKVKPQPPPVSPFNDFVKKAMEGRRNIIEENSDWEEESNNEENIKNEIMKVEQKAKHLTENAIKDAIKGNQTVIQYAKDREAERDKINNENVQYNKILGVIKVENKAKQLTENAIKDALAGNQEMIENIKVKAIRKRINDEENEYVKKLQEKQEGAGVETPRGEWKGNSSERERTAPDLTRGAGINKSDEVERLRNLDLTGYRNEMTSTGDRIYKVASALGINYTVNRKRMSVEALRPMIEAIVGRKAPVIHRGKETKIKGKLDFE